MAGIREYSMPAIFAGPRLALLALVSACALFAATRPRNTRGNVTDPSGAVVAGAKVTITETGNRPGVHACDQWHRRFSFARIEAITYSVTVGRARFRTAEQKDILLTA